MSDFTPMTQNEMRATFEYLFRRCYDFTESEVTPRVILDKRAERFATKLVRNHEKTTLEVNEWYIWQAFGEFSGFIESVFHRQGSEVELYKVFFDKSFNERPEEIAKFSCPEILLDYFPSQEKLQEYFEANNIKRKVTSTSSSIISAAKRILANNGRMPSERWEMITMDGYGRKLANMTLNLVFNKPEIAIDVRIFQRSQDIYHIDTVKYHQPGRERLAIESILSSMAPESRQIAKEYLTGKRVAMLIPGKNSGFDRNNEAHKLEAEILIREQVTQCFGYNKELLRAYLLESDYMMFEKSGKFERVLKLRDKPEMVVMDSQKAS